MFAILSFSRGIGYFRRTHPQANTWLASASIALINETIRTAVAWKNIPVITLLSALDFAVSTEGELLL
jgi:hypothetical protein